VSHKPAKDVSASIRQRLLNLRGALGENFMLILNRYARERLLYRIGVSPYSDRFVLKGAVLFVLWSDEPHRMTQDIDLLGLGDSAVPELVRVFQDICSLPAGDDGLRLPIEEVTAEEIREDQVYGGIRVKITAYLGKMRIPLQVDIGFGDAVIPDPEVVSIPSLLDLPNPRLRAYPRETVIAEKTQAMVVLGMANSRMKDYYDLWILAQSHEFDGALLSEALRTTFTRRQTSIPGDIPIGLSDEFGRDGIKRVQWQAFTRKSGLAARGPELLAVIETMREFLLPPIEAARDGRTFALRWYPGRGWSDVCGKENGEKYDAHI
jgi:predicted nucleotidyltransferase component of viral defense system